MIGHAKNTAKFLHRDQRYGALPYDFHLEQVVSILRLAGYSDELDARTLSAAYLHDAIEDTSYTKAQAEADYGSVVAEIIWAVTDEPGDNRTTRHEKTYPKIKASEQATAVKLADRIANVLESMRTGSSTLGMYQKEHPGFVAGVRKDGYKDARIPFLWTLLDKLIS